MLNRELNSLILISLLLMKALFYKIMSVTMAMVVLVTTMSFSIDMHYCGETLVDFSFVEQVKTCGMEKNRTASNCKAPSLSKESCCSDKQFVQQGQDNLKISFDSLSFEQQTFLTAFTFSYINLFEGTETKEVPFIAYPPPFIERDVQVLHQTFLI